MLYGLSLWIALTVVVMALFAYRFFVSLREDDTVHLADSEAGMIGQQAVLAARLSRIDRLRNALTVVDVVFGLGLLGGFVYQGLHSSGLL